jgi:4'-phosphopantetheinyl transferase
MALLAVAQSTEVGIDVEVDRPVENRLKLARRVFRNEQHNMLEGLPQEQQSRRFLQLWTAMEARQKCVGRGIFDRPADEDELQLFGFVPAPGWLAHVAVGRNGRPPGFRCFDWACTQGSDGGGNEATGCSG